LYSLLSARDHHSLHSFPTRRSSDLCPMSAPEEPDDFRSTMDAQLLQDIVHVILDGRDLDTKTVRDLLVRQITLDESDNLALATRSEEHTSELQSRENLVCRLLLEKK